MPDGGLNSTPGSGFDVPPNRKHLRRGEAIEEDNESYSGSNVIPHTGPRHPHYTSYQARLESYREWPPGLKQTKERMAEAGLYYYGVSDQVKCFYCDGGLREWQEDDDPWVEHAGWFTQCGFVRLVKGDQFIQQCYEDVRKVVVSILKTS